MTRAVTHTIDDALSELSPEKSMPPWLDRDISLPFSKLSGDEFEIICFLLLRAQYPRDRIYYYGKTADMGRDIIHVSANGTTRLIQCKNFSSPISPHVIATEMAKFYINIHLGKIPEKPDEVVFFVADDLSAQSQDLIAYQAVWQKVAHEYLKKFLKNEPPDELKHLACTWWPFGDRQSGLTISEDIRKYNPDSIDTFFARRKVIDASRADVRQDIRDELDSALRRLPFQLESRTIIEASFSNTHLSCDDIRTQLVRASNTLRNWPRTLRDSRWIDRPELDVIIRQITSLPHCHCVLLGEPGSGKSALLSHLANQLEALGISYLGIKADMLDVNVDSLGKLAERLQLPAPVADCVATLAKKEKVVILVDQLDALADLVDLRSERLNVLLNLIRQLAGTPNVYVVASSRTFEFKHDSRFRTIDLTHLQLELPEWEVVAKALNDLKIDGTSWAQSFRDILRVPQKLNIFVEHLCGTSEQKIFDSYQQMLEELWLQKVTRSAEAVAKADLLAAASQQMSDKEVLWLPLAAFDGSRPVIDLLVADGIFRLSDNQMQFGFQHQTLFNHARARAIVQGGIDLYEYVVARQHALFVRPTLWSMLGYLREASRSDYISQMAKLCSGSFRLHVQHLLLDFLGRLQDPDDHEEAWMAVWLDDDDFRKRAIQSISSSKEWFARFKDSHLADLLQDPDGVEWQLVTLLANSINHSSAGTIMLLEENWLKDPTKDQFTIRIFDELVHWSESTVAIVCRMVARTEIHEVFVTGVASSVSLQLPNLAPRIIATAFRRALNELQEASSRPPDVPAIGLMQAVQTEAKVRSEHARQFAMLLESKLGRYEMSAIAQAAPFEFLSEMWPLFVEALTPTLESHHPDVNRYRFSRCLFVDFERESGGPLLESLELALRDLGNSDEDAFRDFFRKTMASDAMLVQRLLCRCLVALPVLPIELALEFLSSDVRRLAIGEFPNYHCDSLELINRIAPLLNAQDLRRLEQSIEAWSCYHAEASASGAKTRRSRGRWDRESRLRLKMAIPREVMSAESRAALASEELALPEVKPRMAKHDSGNEGYEAKSPMSPQQMKKARDSHILKLFDELTDTMEGEHSVRDFGGGTIEASRALAVLAKEDPRRAALLARQLRSADQQIPATHIVDALSEADFPSSQLFELVRELVKLGFDSEEFRESTARACRRRSDQPIGLPDDICAILKRWLRDWKLQPDADVAVERPSESDEERKRSVLFDLLGSYDLPPGTYWVLSALTLGLLKRDRPAYSEWVDALEGHLERDENASTWQAMWLELVQLKGCDPARAVAFLRNLFAKYPSVRDSRFGVRIIAETRTFLGENVFTEICDHMGDSGWTMGKQAKGELLGLSYMASDGFQSVDAFIEGAIASKSAVDSQILKGIAFVAANLWKDNHCRARSTLVFERLAERECPLISEALMKVILFEKFVPNRHSKRILQAMDKFPAVIQGVDAYSFPEMLEEFVISDPSSVVRLSNSLLDQLLSEEDNGHRRNYDLSDAAMTSVAMTLQRMEGQLRADGLDLFERLLTMGFSATAQTIREIDNRPINVPPRIRHRRRRR